MALIVRAFPVLPGKAEEIRKFAAEMTGPRRQEAAEFYRSFGVVRESWHFQEMAPGPMVISITEIEGEPGAQAQAYAESIRPFDIWFKEQVRHLTGVDPNTQPLGPLSEGIFDLEGLAGVPSPS